MTDACAVVILPGVLLWSLVFPGVPLFRGVLLFPGVPLFPTWPRPVKDSYTTTGRESPSNTRSAARHQDCDIKGFVSLLTIAARATKQRAALGSITVRRPWSGRQTLH
jgi:hypothetical protein